MSPAEKGKAKAKQAGSSTAKPEEGQQQEKEDDKSSTTTTTTAKPEDEQEQKKDDVEMLAGDKKTDDEKSARQVAALSSTAAPSSTTAAPDATTGSPTSSTSTAGGSSSAGGEEVASAPTSTGAPSTAASVATTSAGSTSEPASGSSAAPTDRAQQCAAAGLEPDAKSCARFRRCARDLSSSEFKCPAGQLFDGANTRTCLPAELAQCAAGSSADGQPAGEAPDAPDELFREQLGVYPCKRAGPVPFELDCRHFYVCAQESEGGQLRGELLKCPAGSQFDATSGKCSKGAECAKSALSLNPLLFSPSPLIGQAKEASGQFVANK